MSAQLRTTGLLACLALLLIACSGGSAANAGESSQPAPGVTGPTGLAPSATEGDHEVALLAGGCFWCLESAFDDVRGVKEAVSGYAGGTVQNPSYKQVGYDDTGHAEVVRVVYDPKVLSYDRVLEIFWHNIDPFDARGQFCDKGDQYRSAIFPMDEGQKARAEASKKAQEEALGKPFVTKIEPPAVFWRAEDYHQDFHVTNPVRYGSYRLGCGRDKRLSAVWGDKAGH
jgi:peptide-methionine (S)-S-oxide reductase